MSHPGNLDSHQSHEASRQTGIVIKTMMQGENQTQNPPTKIKVTPATDLPIDGHHHSCSAESTARKAPTSHEGSQRSSAAHSCFNSE